MAKTQEVTPYYLRMQTGECFYVDTLKEALEEFLGDEGYRLTLTTTNKELVIRRTSGWVPCAIGLNEKEGTGSLVFREK